MRKIVCLFVLVLFNNLLFAQDDKDILLEGSIGKYPIVLSFVYGNEGIDGLYYYKKSMKDISLKGKQNGKTIVLKVVHPDYKKDTDVTVETFTLSTY